MRIPCNVYRGYIRNLIYNAYHYPWWSTLGLTALNSQIWELCLLKFYCKEEPSIVAYTLKFNTQDLKTRYRPPICSQFYPPSCMPNLQPILKTDSLKVRKPLPFLLDLLENKLESWGQQHFNNFTLIKLIWTAKILKTDSPRRE